MWVLVALIVAAVVLGLWVGGRAHRQLQARDSEDKKKTVVQRATQGATRGLVGLWKWNRNRKKKDRE